MKDTGTDRNSIQKDDSVEWNKTNSTPHIMLFDLYTGGHHPQYLFQLADYWNRHYSEGRLSIVVSSRMNVDHPWLSSFIDGLHDSRIRMVTVPDVAPVEDAASFGLLRNDRVHGRVLKRYIRSLRPDHCVLMYFDHVQVSLATDLTHGLPVTFSGIYFRPSFHYAELGHEQPALKERIKRYRKVVVLKAALRNRHLETLFCLDPFVVPHINVIGRDVHAVFLPDGVEQSTTIHPRVDARTQWRVESGRKVALMFGALDQRKGLFQVLNALRFLPPETQRRTCLVLAGPIHRNDRGEAERLIQDLRIRTHVQIVVDDRYIPSKEIQEYIRSSDVVLLTYQHHIGSSNVLIRAAMEAVPVLGTDYGLVGAQIRRRKLGMTLDATSPREIAHGLERFIEHPEHEYYDAEGARLFAEENSTDKMGETLFNNILQRISHS